MSVYVITEKRSIDSYLKGESLTLIWERTEQTEAQKGMEVLQAQAKALQEQITKLHLLMREGVHVGNVYHPDKGRFLDNWEKIQNELSR
jgi:hypothetical protein